MAKTPMKMTPAMMKKMGKDKPGMMGKKRSSSLKSPARVF